jgi:hypothetical protein
LSIPSLSTVVVVWAVCSAAPSAAQTDSPRAPVASTAVTQLFSAPEESSPPAGILPAGESAIPVAETLGAGGDKWHLIKTKSGVLGWIKQSNSDQSKKLESFFKSLPQESSPIAMPIPSASATAAPRGAVIVPVQFAGRSVIVSALLNRSVTGSLILDTGATSTVISRRLANLLSIRPTTTMVGQTVGGLITAPIARLSSLKIVTAEVIDLSVIIHDFSRDPRIEGLLGMDFLGQFRVSLDSQKQLLVLSPR